MAFTHFLITRFNLVNKIHQWKLDKSQQQVLDQSWLDHRFDLFEKYCFPSVLDQSNKNFQWLLYFDTTTEEKYRQRIEKLVAPYSFIHVLYKDGYGDFQENHTADCLQLNAGKPYVMTTRLDNDDVIHRDFVAKLQEQFKEQEYQAVNFTKLLIFGLNRKNKLHVEYTFSSHYITLIEKVKEGKIEGCYSKFDREWNKDGKALQIKGKAYCMELIHERNYLNDYRGFPVLKKIDLTPFGIDKKVSNTLFDSYFLKPWKMSWFKLLIYLRN